MSNEAPPATVSPTVAAPPPAEDLGLDREFLLSMARIPFIAVGFTALAVAVTWLAPRLGLTPAAGMAGLVALSMVVAAVIDAWAFKVPNWLTLSLVVSGWMIGLLYNFGFALDPSLAGTVGFGTSLWGTALGFLLLGPMLFIGGMGQGDVKMQMGFGAWVGVIFGNNTTPFWLLGGNGHTDVVLGGFILGALAGGLMGLTMMVMRRQFSKNASNLREIVTDLQVLVAAGPEKAAARATQRRPDWVRLPYGVPLCIGYLAYLAWLAYAGHFDLWVKAAS